MFLDTYESAVDQFQKTYERAIKDLESLVALVRKLNPKIDAARSKAVESLHVNDIGDSPEDWKPLESTLEECSLPDDGDVASMVENVKAEFGKSLSDKVVDLKEALKEAPKTATYVIEEDDGTTKKRSVKMPGWARR